jgi:fused signal recognition particle receptor
MSEEQRGSDEQRGARKGFFARLKAGLGRTRSALAGGIADLLRGSATIDDDLLDELEAVLLSADLGVAATGELLAGLRERVARREATDPQAVVETLRQSMLELLEPVCVPLPLPACGNGTFMVLMVGVNGAGKTTSIGKLAHYFARSGRSVMLAAGDTFRAAAVEQLQTWGDRNDIPVVAQHAGADSASVIFDAFQSARARSIDVLLADTAGRLHTQGGLMDELSKVKRVAGKLDETAPHEVLLVLDASIGQNAISQARQFNEAVAVTGLVVTKLDGTAKGGVLFAIAKELAIPVRFIGVGEGIEDLREFDARNFVDALLEGTASP